MLFPIQIPIVGGAAADPSPRTDPVAVPDKLTGRIPDYVPSTDSAPRALMLALEGTAAQTATVQLWVCEEDARALQPFSDSPNDGKALRKWYQYGAALTVTVGSAQLVGGTAGASTAVQLPCPTGLVYFQVTTKPAADATLKAGWLG